MGGGGAGEGSPPARSTSDCLDGLESSREARRKSTSFCAVSFLRHAIVCGRGDSRRGFDRRQAAARAGDLGSGEAREIWRIWQIKPFGGRDGRARLTCRSTLATNRGSPLDAADFSSSATFSNSCGSGERDRFEVSRRGSTRVVSIGPGG